MNNANCNKKLSLDTGQTLTLARTPNSHRTATTHYYTSFSLALHCAKRIPAEKSNDFYYPSISCIKQVICTLTISDFTDEEHEHNRYNKNVSYAN